MVSASRAKRDVWTFLTLLLLFSSVFYAVVLLVADAPKQWGSYVLPFMWCPGLAALITKIVRDRSLRGLGWGWGRTRYFWIAYGLAIALCSAPRTCSSGSRSTHSAEASSSRSSPRRGCLLPCAARAGLLVVVLVISPLSGLIAARPARKSAGGAFSSHGCMHSWASLGTSLLVGLIWAAWHYPINIAVSPLYRPTVPLWYSKACFTLAVIGIRPSCTRGFESDRRASVLLLVHASGNAFQGVLQGATLETSVTSYLTTEYGASFAVAGLVVAFLFWRQRHEFQAEYVRSEAGAS